MGGVVSETTTTPFHVGLTPVIVVDEALSLTRDSHLWGWSIRDLARRLDVAPSVIYHHVGGKDLLARKVVERVLRDLEVPPTDQDWRDWFRCLLGELYARVTACPGSAKWLLMHGPTFPSVQPILDAGIGALQRAGFAARTGFAYAALLNNAMLTVSIADERLMHEDDGPRDHEAMMAEFGKAGAGSPGAAVLMAAFQEAFSGGGEQTERERRRYYDFIVETTIAGVSAQLPSKE